MKKIRPLSPPAPLAADKLHTRVDPARIPWASSDAIPRSKRAPARTQAYSIQPRALQAIDLALHIHNNGYNIYLSGEPHLGRTYMLREILEPWARKASTPPDLIYVNNFADQDKPLLITLPAGQGIRLKKDLAAVLTRVRKELPFRFEADAFVKRRAQILEKFQDVRTDLLKKMDAIAGDKGFNLDMDESGALTLYPLLEGKRLSEEEFDRLDAALRQTLKRKGDGLLHAMAGLMRQLSRAEQSFRDDERALEREITRQVLNELLSPLEDHTLRLCQIPALAEHFAALRADILDNLESFLPREAPAPAFGPTAPLPDSHYPQEPDVGRYDINLFVDNSQIRGAPLMVDLHPTAANLLGCVEREAEMGTLTTNFTLIKAGSLHRANGGFLVLHMEDILQHPQAWEGLMRAVRTGFARIEDISDGQDNIKTKGIEPQALPLNLKVILVGGEEIYENLLINDDRFAKLFKIKAHLAEFTNRNATGIRTYLMRMARMIDEAQLLPFDRGALAWMVDFGSRMVEDQRKLSLKFPLLRELMIEASALAAMRGVPIVDSALLETAFEARTYRANLVEEIFMEEYDRELIKVRTFGKSVGRTNGLSVTWHGDFAFGLPHQIACSVGVGHGGIIDLEREAQMGGPIHTKAMMILKSYLLDQFARRRPLVLTGSLCVEQSYAGIEGDSASAAELVALLSAIADVPVRLDLAFTGALSQSGQIMAVGGVTRKIEGFYKVCARQGLTGTQGVIIPADNVDHLMLSPRIVEAVRQQKFAVYPVQRIEEALTLLTGLPVGRRRADDTFTAGSLYYRVDKRLAALADYAARARTPKKSRAQQS